ncbi:MAG: hypothetical protein ACK5RO_11985 [Pseudobdellovibrionaceae bacterium]
MSLPISLFQFENLIQNRIPFLFVNLGVDLKGFLAKTEFEHLERYQFSGAEVSAESLLHFFSEQKFPLHHAVLVLCEDGKTSQALTEELTGRGLINCFYVLDGYRGLLAEKSSSEA